MSTISITAAQLDWYNRGIVLLMSIMRGRAEHGQAERTVYDEWRSEGELLEVPGMTADVCTHEDCHGEWHECWDCGGDGWVESDDWQYGDEQLICLHCEGDGGWPCPVLASNVAREVNRA